jgi:hypothetical protein
MVFHPECHPSALSACGRGFRLFGVDIRYAVVAFALQRDRVYVVVTLIVPGVLLYNLVGGYR